MPGIDCRIAKAPWLEAHADGNRLAYVNFAIGRPRLRLQRLGDRLQQTVDGVPTNYTLDLNPSAALGAGTGLTQVLDDGTNTYLYGLERLAQSGPGGDEYFLGDALGSMRQLADESGAVVLAEAYEPYGSPAAQAGTGTSIYGFTGEQHDATGLVYLRARYYAPGLARFMSRDSWAGDFGTPLSLNRWNYVGSSPVAYSDPSGHLYCRYGIDPDTGGCRSEPTVSLLPPSSVLPAPLMEFVGQPMVSPGQFVTAGALAILGTCAYLWSQQATAPTISLPSIAWPQPLVSKKPAGGARAAAEHLAMLVHRTVAGFEGQPGGPNPEGRDRRANIVALSAILKTLLHSVTKSGRDLFSYLVWQGWTAKQASGFIDELRSYAAYVLPSEPGIPHQTVLELQALVRALLGQ